MKKEKVLCPLCNIKMEYKENKYICKECGYRILNNSTNANFTESYDMYEEGEDNNNTSGGTVVGPSYNALNHYGMQQVTNPAVYNKTGNAQMPKKKSVESRVVLIIVLCILCITPIILLATLGVLNGNRRSIRNAQVSQNKTVYADDKENETPESEMFRQFVREVFGKSYKEVTTKELKRITVIRLGYTDTGYRLIEYALDNGTTGEFYYDNVYMETSDLGCFKGLEVLDLQSEDIETDDIKGLTKLTELSCGNSPSEIARMIAPKQLTKLGLNSSFYSSSLDGIETFTNLSELSVKSRYIEDISALSGLKKLKKLEILNAESLEDFTVLNSMTQLEGLYLDCKHLRDIGFVSKMSSLKDLTIANSQILKVDDVGDCKETLEKLNFIDNYQVKNYDVVLELTKLTELTLHVSSSGDHNLTLPDLSGAKSLKSLAISCYDDISSLEKLTGLEELSLTRIYDNGALPSLPNLKTLKILDTSVFETQIQSVSKFTGLEHIDLTGSFIWTDINHIFELPNIKEVIIDDCTAGFDMANIPNCETLEILRIKDSTLKQLQDGKWDYKANNENNIAISENTEMFTKFAGLKKLQVTEAQIEDISFVKQLKQLEVLDITDNYVTDLSVMKEHDSLRYVLCSTNPVTDDGEGGKILMKE